MMKALAGVALAACLAGPAWAQDDAAPLLGRSIPPLVLEGLRCHRNVEATDGDSIVWRQSGGSVAASRGRVRSIDTPERNGRCPEERALAEVAREELLRQMQPCVYILTDGSVDNYGRSLVWLFNQRGEEIARAMVAKKLAHRYDGSGPRGGWCPDPAARPRR